MTRPLPHASPTPAVAWPLVAALFVATPAFAQGTAEQREACTEDAIRLCPDAIPDVDRTTACMKAHEAQLSRRCHRVFSAEEETPRAQEPRRAAREPGAVGDDFDRPGPYRGRGYEYEAPGRAAPGRDEGYYERRRVAPDADDGYDAPRRVAPDEGYYEPRRAAPAPDADDDDRPRRIERAEPNPYDDGYGPRRYLYSTPQGPAETPY